MGNSIDETCHTVRPGTSPSSAGGDAPARWPPDRPMRSRQAARHYRLPAVPVAARQRGVKLGVK